MRLTTTTPRPKYGNKKTTLVGGETFDSKAEARRWTELLLLVRTGKLSGLKRQVAYELVPAVPRDGEFPALRALRYVADFVYEDENGDLVVEDVKGFRTREFKLKSRLMLWRHGIRIREIK
jgi:hypothetical protein